MGISVGKDEATAREWNKQCTSRCLSPEESTKLLIEKLQCEAFDIIFDCKLAADEPVQSKECQEEYRFKKEFEDLLQKTETENVLDSDQYGKLLNLVGKTAKGRGSRGKICGEFEYYE